MHHRGDVKPAVFNVTDVEVPAMLACEMSRDLGLVQFNCSIMQVQEDLLSSSASQSNDRRAAHLNQPFIHHDRSMHVHLIDDYKRKIDNMLKLGVIMPVEKPTDWVNSIVLSETTHDKGEITKLRVCLDPRDLKKMDQERALPYKNY